MLIKIFTLIFLLIISCNNNNAKIPEIKPNQILRPLFQTTEGEFMAGTAFSIKVDNVENPIVITAVHLFGPDGGLEKVVQSEDLPQFIQKVILNDAFDYTYTGECTEVIKIMEATKDKSNKDIAAFLADEKFKFEPLEVHNGTLDIGEPIWLAASVINDEINQKIHKATVEYNGEDKIVHRFENQEIDITATSGAPLLNSEGKVVGINIGGAKSEGVFYGIANPSISFMKILNNSLNP